MPTSHSSRSRVLLLAMIALLQLGLAPVGLCPAPGQGGASCCGAVHEPAVTTCCDDEAPDEPTEPVCPCEHQPAPAPDKPGKPKARGPVVDLGFERSHTSPATRVSVPSAVAVQVAWTGNGPPIFRLHCALLI